MPVTLKHAIHAFIAITDSLPNSSMAYSSSNICHRKKMEKISSFGFWVGWVLRWVHGSWWKIVNRLWINWHHLWGKCTDRRVTFANSSVDKNQPSPHSYSYVLGIFQKWSNESRWCFLWEEELNTIQPLSFGKFRFRNLWFYLLFKV